VRFDIGKLLITVPSALTMQTDTVAVQEMIRPICSFVGGEKERRQRRAIRSDIDVERLMGWRNEHTKPDDDNNNQTDRQAKTARNISA
jgi:hypothetical protein